MTAATFLFVPAHQDHKVRKALASAADAVILDLEDSVPPAKKEDARSAAAGAIRAARSPGGPQLWVRVNSSGSVDFAEDLRAIDWSRAEGVVLPKAEDPGAVAKLLRASAARQLLLVETAVGLGRLPDFAAAGGETVRLAIGTWDLARDLRLQGIGDPDESAVIWHVRCEMVLQSRRLGLDAPVDGIFGALKDLRGLEEVCQRVRRLGFGGKLLVHPDQIAVAARAFWASPAHLVEAQEIVDAYDEAVRAGCGATQHRGKLIDRVQVERARDLLAGAETARAVARE